MRDHGTSSIVISMFEKTDTLQFRIIRIAVAIGLTLTFLLSSHPARVPALMLVVPFMAIFVCLYWIALEFVRLFQPGDDEGSRGEGRRIYRPRLLAAVIAGFPVTLLVLQSIMELNRWDVLIALGIFLMAYVLVSRGTLSVS